MPGIELLSNQVIKTVEEYFYGDCKLGLPAWRISMAPCCFRFVPDMRSLLDKFYEKQKVSSKSRREKSRQHCQLQPVAWKVSKRINFPAINFPTKHQEISGVFFSSVRFSFPRRIADPQEQKLSAKLRQAACHVIIRSCQIWRSEESCSLEHGATFWLSGECESWSLKVQRHWPSSTGQFIQCFTLCAFLCILHSFAKFLERHFTARRQEDHEYSDESRSEGLTCEGEVPHVTRSCTPSFAGSYWIEHARQRWGLRYLQLTGFVPKLQIWSCFRHSWLPRCKNQTHKQVALWVWEVNNMKGFSMVFTHTVTKTRMNTQSIHIHFIYIHHSMGSMCSHILTHHASPIFDLGHFLFYKAWQSWPAWVIIFLYPVDQRFINMSHVWLCRTEPGLAVVPGSSVQPSSPVWNRVDVIAVISKDRFIELIVLLCFGWGCTSLFIPYVPSLESQNSYQPTSTNKITMPSFMKVLPWHYKSPLAGPKSQFPSRRLQPREREHQYDWKYIENIEYVSFIQGRFSSSTYTRSCRNKSWIANVPYESLWYLSYILNSIQGSSNIMNIQHFNIHNLDIISEYITPPPGPQKSVDA